MLWVSNADRKADAFAFHSSCSCVCEGNLGYGYCYGNRCQNFVWHLARDCPTNLFLALGLFVLGSVFLCNVPPPPEGNAVWGIRCFMGVCLAYLLLGALGLGCGYSAAIYLLFIVGVPVRAPLHFLTPHRGKRVWVTTDSATALPGAGV